MTLPFALQLFRRDLRNGELQLLSIALVLAVAAVTSVEFFTDRVDRAMELQAGEVLAADLVLASNDPLPDSYRQQADRLGLQTAQTISFPSVVMRGEKTQLVEVKAVSPSYPLRGRLMVRSTPGEPEQEALQPPRPGGIWVQPRLLAALEMQAGDRLSLGEAELRVTQVISRDPGETANIFRLGPGALLALEDIPATGLVTPASRVRHRLLLAGTAPSVERYRNWAARGLPKGISLTHMSSARPELRNTLDRGKRFLGLAALVAVLLAGAAVALSSRRFVERQADASAILRCLGASRALILKVLLIRLLLLALLASLLGAALGFLAQFLLTSLIGSWFSTELPLPGMRPLAIGAGTGLITLLGFVLPPALRLGSVPPLRVLRRDLSAPPVSSWTVGLFALAAMALLMLWQAGEPKLAALVLAGTLLTVGLLLVTARLLIRLLTPLRHRGGTIWRYGLAGLARNPAMTALQLTGFGIGILALLLLAIVRVDLLAAWERTIPSEVPNQFLINIQPAQVDDLQLFMQANDLGGQTIYPMLRARLTRINDRQVMVDDYIEDRARRLVTREFNLSRSARMQSDNRIVAGRWWHPDQHDQPLFSVELDLARTLGIEMNDRLTFELAGNEIQGRVSNLRTVKWDSFHPNFFVIGTPGLLQDYPTTFITSFYLPPGRERVISRLVQRFPSITIIDVTALLRQIRDIISRGSLAVEYVFLFTLGTGLLVLYAGIQASREHRRQESAILRTLGLKRRDLLLAMGVEFFSLGLLAGLLASLSASLTGWLISSELFGLEYAINPWLWVAGILGGGIGIGAAGVLASYPLVIRPPLQTLREG